MKLKFIGAVALLLGMINSLAAMPFDPLIGTWKVIDDRTGYYISDIVIRKDSKTEQYRAVVTKNYPLPGAPMSEVCTKCAGVLKNQPFFGMETLRGLVANGKDQQFSKGVWINTQDGKTYHIDAQLNESRDLLKVQGKAKGSNTMSNMTWKKL
ncbi:DUF2147 domain-containing protein [Acinetobacter sp. RF14B]|uniref:DUF2147 domain-containing protein n=1 Tax=Acinetobacter sp. RF14B TaxID=2650965 RepID=UPI00117589A2|nr:DUF2147 domain-containing protein [Acinetobacter sp. RF14B]TQR58576.1 DUF2147 domain-containing protein [Acinetobacter sp. RF14B]